MISLEALFNESPSDIKYKIAHRAGFLLGFCNLDSKDVFEKLKVFYNHRSHLVHGGGSPDYDPDRFEVSRYARLSIIIFLILLKKSKRRKIGKNKRRTELLREIDYAMFDVSKREGIRKEIEKGIKDFTIEVPRTFEGKGKSGKYRVTAW